MDDRELLELAAKAAGFKLSDEHYWHEGAGQWVSWNPLTDDGEALWLMVKLGLRVSVESDVGLVEVDAPDSDVSIMQPTNDNPYTATRRAIVRAAAEIGKGVVQEKGGALPEDNYYKTQAEAEQDGRAAAEIGRRMR